MRSARVVVLGVIALSGCDPGKLVFCEDGRFDAALTFRQGGFAIDFDEENLIPYEDRAFERCTFVNGLLFGDAEVSDEQFPSLEVLGAFNSNIFDTVSDPDEVKPDVVVGFNGVTDLGQLKGVKEVGGFNNVVRANFIQTPLPTGFVSLEEVGELFVTHTEGLGALRKAGDVTVQSTGIVDAADEIVFPALSEVLGSLTITTAAIKVAVPALRSLGGDLRIDSCADLVDLVDIDGRGPVSIAGLISLTYNSYAFSVPEADHGDQYFIDWMQRNRITAAEGAFICQNGSERLLSCVP